MRLFIFLLIQLTGMHMYAQEQQCSLTIEGQVIDLATNEHLEFANVFVEDLNTGVVTDHSGHFSLTNLCPGGVHLRISHIGCEEQRVFVLLSSDTSIVIKLDHHSEMLEQVQG